MSGDKGRGTASVLWEAPTLARPSARSLPSMEECPGIHWKWTTFDSERVVSLPMMSDCVFGMRKPEGRARVERTDWESDRSKMESKLQMDR